MSKIVVVGANHAGTSAINTILNNYGEENEVVVFDQNSNISFLGCGMALWIGKQISGPEGLFYSSKEKLEAAGAKVYMESPVVGIDYDKKEVTALVNGKEHVETYDKLILATGSQPILPPIKGAEFQEGSREFKAKLENLQFVKLYQNSAEVIEKLNNPDIKRVAVVGAGYIGVELAEAFERLNKEVTLVDIATTSLGGYYDPEFTELMNKNLADHGIKLAFGQTVQAVEGNGKVERLVTDKETFDVDMVILAVGFRPNTALGNGKLELFRNGAFLVNKKGQTNLPDVYAIGDCATVYDNALNDTNYIALATNAVRTAIVAAHNACGTEIETAGVQGSNGIAIYDLKMVSTGLTLEKAKRAGYNAVATDFSDLQKPEFMEEDNHEVKIRIVYDKDTRVVLGAQMASKEDISMGMHMFSLAIQEKVTIERLALLDILFLPHFNKPYNYITMAALSAK
ncbi:MULTISPECIES: H2O-forming NADH oxidase [unclassified Gemella]|uniref:H2O-forming NADH oxidase n=1 Tax=unclassified Gemella TaxID=2624949 RepID=UPI00107422E2|nr:MULTISPECIES: FAD-dependent oxidoreductase [unclassified Gemella]MBF0709963.1 FAD-dependent oxidoreductase [Gemella sp. GL1.1]MBF0747334.1 FAD-dependent oxidoreductase [Gemella sp. 19428wG2_WT2a]NYS27307.1 FAD-dependent oxidoreductase [Gemella sp. GL1]TFU57527.1 NADH oxidase [Gemella sp. WT2a]